MLTLEDKGGAGKALGCFFMHVSPLLAPCLSFKTEVRITVRVTVRSVVFSPA